MKEVADALMHCGRYMIVVLTDELLALRYSGKPERQSWPEDATVSIAPAEIHLTIHAGTGTEREQLLVDLETAFRSFGITLKFEDSE